MLADSFLIESMSKFLATKTGETACTSAILTTIILLTMELLSPEKKMLSYLKTAHSILITSLVGAQVSDGCPLSYMYLFLHVNAAAQLRSDFRCFDTLNRKRNATVRETHIIRK